MEDPFTGKALLSNSREVGLDDAVLINLVGSITFHQMSPQSKITMNKCLLTINNFKILLSTPA
jgi:hypothetical protein